MALEILALISTAVSAFGSIAAGAGAQASAELGAFNLETENILGKAQALEQSRLRHLQYKDNLSANIAAFSSQGRLGSVSVDKFLERQKQMVGEDISAIAFQQQMNSLISNISQAEARRKGREAMASGMISGFTTMVGGIYRYNQTKTPAE